MKNRKSSEKFAKFLLFEYNISVFILLFGSMKKFVKILMFLVACTAMYSFSFAQEWRWWKRWASPIQVFDNVVGKANQWHNKIQETALDTAWDINYNWPYKITNTLEYLRQNIAPYIQWAVYIWFVASTAWLIICWFLLVTWWISKSGWFDKVKWKIVNALLAVFVLSGFYLLIKLMVWLINTFFWE